MNRLRSYVVSQFRRPRGLVGRLAGRIMTGRPSNRARNAWTVDQLELESNHRVLEIGFGPGIALEAVLARCPEGRVVGVDHSGTMRAQAAARNRKALDSGRLRLVVGCAEHLPADLAALDRIYSANVVQFLEDPDRVFADLLTRLSPGGLIASTFQPRHSGATARDADRMAARIQEQMIEAGFESVRLERLELRPIPVVCVLGRRPTVPADRAS